MKFGPGWVNNKGLWFGEADLFTWHLKFEPMNYFFPIVTNIEGDYPKCNDLGVIFIFILNWAILHFEQRKKKKKKWGSGVRVFSNFSWRGRNHVYTQELRTINIPCQKQKMKPSDKWSLLFLYVTGLRHSVCGFQLSNTHPNAIKLCGLTWQKTCNSCLSKLKI